MQWHRDKRNECIDPHDYQPEHWLIEPDQAEYHESIDYGPEKSHWNTDHYDKDVIHYELDVLVYKTHNGEEFGKCLGTSIFIETLIKIQLRERERGREEFEK